VLSLTHFCILVRLVCQLNVVSELLFLFQIHFLLTQSAPLFCSFRTGTQYLTGYESRILRMLVKNVPKTNTW
jgi:hypothetical protein